MLDCPEARRWIRQAEYTIASARLDLQGGYYSWACFKAHQAGEYALKALLRASGLESFGHDLLRLWSRAKELCRGLERLRDCVALLNKMYIPPRYPDAWPGEAAPFESYTERDAVESISCAQQLLMEVKRCLEDACAEEQDRGLATGPGPG